MSSPPPRLEVQSGDASQDQELSAFATETSPRETLFREVSGLEPPTFYIANVARPRSDSVPTSDFSDFRADEQVFSAKPLTLGDVDLRPFTTVQMHAECTLRTHVDRGSRPSPVTPEPSSRDAWEGRRACPS